MKKLLKKFICMVLVITMLCTVDTEYGFTKAKTVKAETEQENPTVPIATIVDNIAKKYYSIWFTKDDISLMVGKSTYVTIERSGFSGGVVNYVSYDEDVVTVDGSGKITAKGQGNTVIEAMCIYNNQTFSAYCDVSVKANYSLSKKKISLYINDSYKLKVKGYSRKVKWKTTNKKVAVVKNGKVTAKKKGSATIYCVVDGRKLRCKVKVRNPFMISGYITEGFYRMPIIFGKSKKGKWWTANKNIATVNSKGRIYGVRPGKTKLYYKTRGVVTKCVVLVKKNVGTFKKHYKGFYNVPYGTIGYNVLKIYFDGNAMKVKLRMFNKSAYTLEKYEYSKFKFKISGAKTFRKEIFNISMNVKPFSTKDVTVTLSTNPYYKKHYNFGNRNYTLWWTRDGAIYN